MEYPVFEFSLGHIDLFTLGVGRAFLYFALVATFNDLVLTPRECSLEGRPLLVCITGMWCCALIPAPGVASYVGYVLTSLMWTVFMRDNIIEAWKGLDE